MLIASFHAGLFFRAPSRGKQTVLTSVMLILSGYTTLSAHPNVTNKQEHQLSQLFGLGTISEVFQAFYSIDFLKCVRFSMWGMFQL